MRTVIIILFVWASISATFSQEGEVLYIGTRGNESKLAEVINEKLGSSVILSRTREFDNGNTFVQLQTKVSKKNVAIIMPAEFTPNTLMEFLIKIFTLKNEGAKRISVMIPREVHSASFYDYHSHTPVEFSGFGPEAETEIGKLLNKLMYEAGARDIIFEDKTSEVRILNGSIDIKINGLDKTQKGKIVIDARSFESFGDSMKAQLQGHTVDVIKNDQDAESLKKTGNLSNYKVLLTVPAGVETNKHFFDFVVNTYQYKRLGAKVLGLMPYFHYARTDKKDQKGVAITGSYIASILESMKLNALFFARLHAPQAQGFFRKMPTYHIWTRETISARLKSEGVDLVVAPDNGATKEATLFADAIGVPVETINKFRDPITGDSMIRGISDNSAAQGKIVAVIDDETASGSTGGNAAKILKKLNAAKVIFVVTHLAGNAKKALTSPDIDKIIVTNSLPIDNSTKQERNIEVLDISPEFGEAVKEFIGIGEKNTRIGSAVYSKCAMALKVISI